MVKKLVFLIAILTTINKSAFAQKELGHITTTDNKIIYLYPQVVEPLWWQKKGSGTDTLNHFYLSNETVNYFDKDGRSKTINQKKIQELYFDKKLFINLPIRKQH